MSRNFFSNPNVSRLKQLTSNHNLSPRGGSVGYPTLPQTPETSSGRERVSQNTSKSDYIDDARTRAAVRSLAALEQNISPPNDDAEDDEWRPGRNSEDNEVLQDPYVPTRSSQQMLEQYTIGKSLQRREHDAEQQQGRPKRNFIDRQPDASRVEFDDPPGSGQPTPVPVGRASRKRKLANRSNEGDEDDDQDDAFQQDTRPTNAEARRREAPVAARRQAIREMSTEHHDDDAEDAHEVEQQQQRERRERREQREQRQERASEDAAREFTPTSRGQSHLDDDPGSVYQQVQAEARRRVATRLPPKVQTRQKWSTEETSLLIRCVQKYGTSWSRIVQSEPLFNDRGQVGLKDKARNIKFDYL
ncbi:hypothetical protein L228DRAFT_285170, partial [Xylona heveae TC161]